MVYVYVPKGARPAGAHAVGWVDGEIACEPCTVHFKTCSCSVPAKDLSPGAWPDVKGLLGDPGVLGEVRMFVLHAADSVYMKDMWPAPDIGDDDPICKLYEMTAEQVQGTISLLLRNLCLIGGTYEWIKDVYEASVAREQTDWNGAETEGTLLERALPDNAFVNSLMSVEVVVSCIDDILKLPLATQVYIMPSTMIHSSDDMHIGMGLFTARALRRGDVVTQYDGAWVDTPKPGPNTTHHMSVVSGFKCISGVRTARLAIGAGGLSFCNSKTRRLANLGRFLGESVSRIAFGKHDVPRVVFARARHAIPAHSELFMWYRVQGT